MYHVYVTAAHGKADKLEIIDQFSCLEYGDFVWPRLISDGQYEATGQLLLDDTRANKILKEAGYTRDGEWKQVHGGFWTTATKDYPWPAGTIGEESNK